MQSFSYQPSPLSTFPASSSSSSYPLSSSYLQPHQSSAPFSSGPEERSSSPAPSNTDDDGDELMYSCDDEGKRGFEGDGDESFAEVDRSFSEAMSVADASPADSSSGYFGASSMHSGKYVPAASGSGSGASNNNVNANPGRRPSMLSHSLSADDDDDEENQEEDDDDYHHARMEMSPTAARKTTKTKLQRPMMGHAYSLGPGAGGSGVGGMSMGLMTFSSKMNQMNGSDDFGPPLSGMMGMQNSGGSFASKRAFGKETSRGNMMMGGMSQSEAASKGMMPPPVLPLRLQKKGDVVPAAKTAPLGGTFKVPALPTSGMSDENTVRPTNKRPRMGLPGQWDDGAEQERRRSAGQEGLFTGSPCRDDRLRPSPRRGESAPTFQQNLCDDSPLKRNAVSFADGMELDTPYRPHTAEPEIEMGTPGASESPNFGNLFGANDSPEHTEGYAQLRQAAGLANNNNSDESESSPGSAIDSPSTMRPPSFHRMMEKSMSANVTGAGGLFGTTRMGKQHELNRRAQPYKLPPLAPLAAGDEPARVATTASAFPMLEREAGQPSQVFPGLKLGRNGLPTMRRAFSVCDQGSPSDQSGSSDDTDNSPSVAAAGRVVSHIETSTNVLHPMQHIGGRITPDGGFGGPERGNPNSPFAQAGLLGFGANEKEGKILPCHRVKEDGLVRINNNTLKDVIEGVYSDQISRYHIIDCRFEYEFNGGHIDGAINVNTTNAVEELFLKQGNGIYKPGETLPNPTKSGEAQERLPVMLIFHCEFSNKRAPAFAKHFRSKDRNLNNHVYPKVHYPELYILEGGYCDFFRSCPTKCEPQAYVPMDDPKHCEKRDSDLHDFRKFTRTRSFTYGENQPPAPRPSQPCPPPAFAAANAAVNRRVAGIKEEDDSQMSSPAVTGRPKAIMELDSPGDSVDGSPCARFFGDGKVPPSQVQLGQPIFGSTKNRALGTRLGRNNFTRNASFAGTTQQQSRPR